MAAIAIKPEGSARPSALRTIPEGALRVGPIMGVPETLRDLGADPAEVLARAGIDPGLLADPENLIELGALGRL